MWERIDMGFGRAIASQEHDALVSRVSGRYCVTVGVMSGKTRRLTGADEEDVVDMLAVMAGAVVPAEGLAWLRGEK